MARIRIRFEREFSRSGLIQIREDAGEALMSLGQQIEEYEHPYHVVYGTVGEEPKLVPGKEGDNWPIWRARPMVVALLTAQINKLPDDDPEAVALLKIRQAFQEATTGEVVWGMVRSWRNKKGVKRFIGIIEKGRTVTDAGRSPKGFVPSKHHPKPSIDRNNHLRHGVGHGTAKPVTPPPQSEAERIADRMAKSARAAVEDQD